MGVHPHLQGQTTANARRFLRDLERACPIRIRTILTDQAVGTPLVRETVTRGKEFTDRQFGLRRRAATGEYAFGKFCAKPGVGYRLTPPGAPQTNGMVGRFNGRIEDVLQATASGQVRGWKPRFTAMSGPATGAFPILPPAPSRLCKRQGNGTMTQTQTKAVQQAAVLPCGM